jgi:hypothetical protein
VANPEVAAAPGVGREWINSGVRGLSGFRVAGIHGTLAAGASSLRGCLREPVIPRLGGSLRIPSPVGVLHRPPPALPERPASSGPGFFSSSQQSSEAQARRSRWLATQTKYPARSSIRPPAYDRAGSGTSRIAVGTPINASGTQQRQNAITAITTAKG